MEVCGRDESKQDKDAGVDEELHAHDAVDQQAHEDMDTKCDIVGLQKSEPWEVVRCVCDGLPSFRHFCHLSGFAVRDVRCCHRLLSTCHLYGILW